MTVLNRCLPVDYRYSTYSATHHLISASLEWVSFIALLYSSTQPLGSRFYPLTKTFLQLIRLLSLHTIYIHVQYNQCRFLLLNFIFNHQRKSLIRSIEMRNTSTAVSYHLFYVLDELFKKML